MGAILALGYAIFAGSHLLTELTGIADRAACRTAACRTDRRFYITNYTSYRRPFEEMLHKISPPVYLVFSH